MDLKHKTICTVAHRTHFFSKPLAVLPQGGQGCQKKREKPTEFEFLSFRCDHEVLRALEAKNRSKRAKFHQKRLFLSGFWPTYRTPKTSWLLQDPLILSSAGPS